MRKFFQRFSRDREDMKIRDVETRLVGAPLGKTFLAGTYRKDVTKDTIITRIITDEGVVGESFVGDVPHIGRTLVHLIQSELKNDVIGEDLFSVERIWNKLFAHYRSNEERVLMQAIGHIDCAIWDGIGKACHQPLYKLLGGGGYREKVPIISLGGYYLPGREKPEESRESIEREILDFKAKGMIGIKFKVGRLHIHEDLARVKIAREAAGDDFVIAVDANKAWTPRQAKRFAALATHHDLNLRWIEEPCSWYYQAKGMNQVRAATEIPICAGQSEITRWGCHALMEQGAIDVCNVDTSYCGGITEWMKIAHLATLYDVEMAHHEEYQIAMHLFGAIGHGTYAECFANPDVGPLYPHIIANKKVEGGYIYLPETPGLGLDLNETFIADHTYDASR
jgi:D-arabinonate dehydratase